MTQRTIGVLDTGIGGLNTFAKVHQRIPQCDLIYVGDNRNLPHNIHPPEWICGKAQSLIDFLLEKGATELVIACHTISTLLPNLDTGKATVYDIVRPTLGFLKVQPQGSHSVFIGTRTTIESGRYQPDFLNPKTATYIAAVQLATLIEHEGPEHNKTLRYLEELMEMHLSPLEEAPSQVTIFPVCTHYFLVKSQLLRIVQNLWPDTLVEFVEPSSLLVDHLPKEDSTQEGMVNIYLNADHNEAFDLRMESIFELLEMENFQLGYIHLS